MRTTEFPAVLLLPALARRGLFKPATVKKWLLIGAIVSMLFAISANNAFALDICVQDMIGDLYKFDKVKLLKGKTTLLAGRFHDVNNNLEHSPFHGAVTLEGNEITTRIGITIYRYNYSVSTLFMIGDKNFNATDAAGGPWTWTNVPCSAVPPA